MKRRHSNVGEPDDVGPSSRRRAGRRKAMFEGSDEEEQGTVIQTPEMTRKRGRESEAGGTSANPNTRNFVRGDDGFIPGNIVNLELKNFMTYDYIEATPGARLNLIIGPNGTGKSSLVCAICIGLAGEPKLLGRAGNIGDYVQRGHNDGFIRITLRGETPEERIAVLRKINTANKSEWFLNDIPCRKEDVKALAKRLNIQVDNLTQFLPQDRVCEFAKLSAVDLLKETEKAVGDPELYEQHEYLTATKDQLLKLETTVNQTGDTLRRLKAENADLEKDVENMNQRTQLLEKADLMRMKLPWLQYEKVKVDYLEAKETAKGFKKELEEVQKRLEEEQAPLIEAKRAKDAVTKQAKQISDNLGKKHQRRANLANEEEDLANKVRAKEMEIVQRSREADHQQAKLEHAREVFEIAQHDCANFQVSEPPTDRLKVIDEQLTELKDKDIELEQDMRTMRRDLGQKNQELNECRRRLGQAENYQGKIMKALADRVDRNIYETKQWVDENRHRMKGPVYGPIATEVQVSDPLHAKYLEGNVATWLWKCFITTNAEDRDLLVNSVKADVINCPNPDRMPSGRELTDQAKALGVTHRLDEVIDAPAVVKSVLCTQAAIHMAFIGSDEAERNVDALARLNILNLWTPRLHFSWITSSYHSNMTCISKAVRPCMLFTTGMAKDEIAQLQRTGAQIDHDTRMLNQRIEDLVQQRAQIATESTNLENERDAMRKEYNMQKKTKKELRDKVERLRTVVESLQRVQDPKRVQEKLKEEIGKLEQERYKKTMLIYGLLKEIGTELMRMAPLQLAKVELDAKLQNLERTHSEYEGLVRMAKEQQEEADRAVLRLRDELRKALEAGKRVVDLNAHPEVQQEFEQFPGSVEALRAAIQDVVSEANILLCSNPNVVEEYEQRQSKIREIEEGLEDKTAELQQLHNNVESIKGKWLPRLQDLVAKINDTFGHNFAEMAVAGEVSLDEQGMDFDKYGILIKVKFRETGELQVLSAHHQSGGERSVSTILYLVSLQAITQCPFRVVDEINQGMDPNNERKMFQQLVRAASQPNTPQTFLLTPKLLSDLDYGTSCSVLNIMNGPYLGEVSQGAFKRGTSLASALHSLATVA